MAEEKMDASSVADLCRLGAAGGQRKSRGADLPRCASSQTPNGDFSIALLSVETPLITSISVSSALLCFPSKTIKSNWPLVPTCCHLAATDWINGLVIVGQHPPCLKEANCPNEGCRLSSICLMKH